MHRKLLTALTLAVGVFISAPTVCAQTNHTALPEFGGNGTISLAQEYQLGRAWLMSFRRQAPTFNDPQLQDYIEHLLYDLAVVSELKDRRLDLIVVDNPTINAFAVPGGVVGVHTGLLAKAETEAQFASVLTHELAHVSQRHFARGVEAQQRASIPSMVGLLAGVVLAATAGGDVGMATIAGSQAAAMQNQLRYSRLHEQEADRIGMQTMVRAQMNPFGAEEMFKIMQATYGGGSKPPEFLMTHPLTGSRISDASNRARQYPRKMYTENLQYQLMRARVLLAATKDGDQAVDKFRRLLAKERERAGDNAVAAQYGLALALMRKGDTVEARKLLMPLREFDRTNMTYGLAEAQLLLAEGRFDKALALLQRGVDLVPGNHAITMALADAQMQAGDPHKAAATLNSQSKNRPNDPGIWYQLAEAQGKAGNTLGVHQARAEYFILSGQFAQARQQLQFALKLPANNALTVSRLQERIKQVEAIARALKAF